MTEQQPKKLHGTAFRAVTAIVAVMLLFTSTATTLAYAQTVRTVTVTDGDSTKVISTDSTSPEEIIRQAGFMLSANDAVDASGLTSAGGILKISRAKTVKVIDNNDIVYCIGYDTLGKTLEDRGFGAVEEYSPEMPLDEDVYNGMEVVLVRAFPVTIVADGEEQKLYTMGSTVSELLDKAGVEVGEDDKVSQAPEADISGSSTITVDRVEYVERTVKEDIPFKTETKKTNDLYEDETKVVTAGVNGEKEIVYKDTVVNGEVTETVKVSETVTKEPVNEVKNE
ncbi:MAG: G5 domain-containing protein, partial [Clostridia bacterium]|nr:G5 domain-containing protein [Clostridia bacterium]